MSKKTTIILSAIALGILGSLLHGAYDFLGCPRLVGLFVPINESTWEHMKLFFFPMLVISYFLYKKYSEDIPLLFSGLIATTLLGTWLIPVLFYTYRGILGFGVSAIDISTYFISVLLSFLFLWNHYLSDHAVQMNQNKSESKLLPILAFIQAILFLYFTYRPLTLGIFSDPTK